MSKVELLGQYGRNAGQTEEMFYGDDIEGVVHVFDTTTARDLVPIATFRNGELCRVRSPNAWYELSGGSWVAYTGFSGGGGGGGMGFPFTYAGSGATGDADPGAGTFRGNNATLASSTKLFVDDLESGGTTVSGWLATFDDAITSGKGKVRLQSKSDPTKWLEFPITAYTSASGYSKIDIGTVVPGSPGGITTTAGDTQLIFDAGATGSVPWSSMAASVGNLAFYGFKDLNFNGEIATTGATPAVDFTTGAIQKTTLTANATPTITPPASGVGWYLWKVVQGGSGGYTVTFPGSITPTPPQPASALNARTAYLLYWNGTAWEFYGLVDLTSGGVVGVLPNSKGGRLPRTQGNDIAFSSNAVTINWSGSGEGGERRLVAATATANSTINLGTGGSPPVGALMGVAVYAQGFTIKFHNNGALANDWDTYASGFVGMVWHKWNGVDWMPAGVEGLS